MRILIIGNDPHDVGGVANYTRPLASKFAELGHDVFCFYSGAWNKRYNWLFKPYLKVQKSDFPFECAELINSPNWTLNYGAPSLDMHAPQTEKLFRKYLRKKKPDVVHVHSRLGLPASIIEIASSEGNRVFNTIHAHGLLCQKRVMIDRRGETCPGPEDLTKCVLCRETLPVEKMKLVARMENTNRSLLRLLVRLKKRVIDRKEDREIPGGEGSEIPDREIARSRAELKKRLDYMIHLMNDCVAKNICVSSDVQRTLLKFGVCREKLLVQHIGSTIAENQPRLPRPLHSPMVIGNIGGVGYYKGIHVLVDAASKIRAPFVLKIFGKYEKDYVENIMQGKEKLPIEFLGRYKPVDLARILREIDIMVLPSICNDTAPQTIFESYSAGIPIIASDIGGFPDFIKPGVNGFLFRPGDSQDLAEKLEEVLSHPDIIPAFAENIPRLKTITENVRELLELYKNHDRE
jgi:glycosyltransferase involved in cell wall biosynthesis